jgi:hypothetical protein
VIISAGTLVEYPEMATTAPFVKLLRQLSGARDDYRTGAFDLSWEGGKATLFLVFGQPNHATLQTAGGRRLEGQAVLTALVNQLPARFEVSPWRREVVRAESLRCSLDELIEPFTQMAGAVAPEVPAAPSSGASGVGTAPPDVDFGLEDFPLLPLGPSLWADAAASVVHLDVLMPNLPDALVVITGPRLRAAGVVVRQHLVDALWIDDEELSTGEAAAMAMMEANQGSVSGYRLESAELAESLTMLWRCPVAHRAIPAAWVRPESLLADLEHRRRDCALVVNGSVQGVALFAAGKLVGVYTAQERQPTPSSERLIALLRAPGATLTVRQHPDEPRAEHLPEASFHAFVEAAAADSAPVSEDGVPGIEEGVSTPRATRESAADATGESSAEQAVWPPPPPPPPETAAVPDGPAWLAGLSVEAEAAPGPPLEPASTSPVNPDPSAQSMVAGEPDGTDFEGVKRDLIQIGVLWLGADGATEASAMIERAHPSVEDILSTIDAIATLSLPAYEPSVLQAMTREMRFHAAECLSGL